MKQLLIVKTATSFDDLPTLCETRGDEVAWFSEASGLAAENVTAVSPFTGETLPDPEAFQAIIITGSVDMISDDLPWIKTTASWLKQALDKQIPILGVCFGHHLLAHVLGGKVGRNPNGAEFGLVDLEKTATAQDDPLFKDIPNTLKMHAFHYESVLELPQGAVLLAANAHDPHHAFRYGPNAWGVQFHPEFDPEIMSHAIDVYQTDMADAGYDVDTLRKCNIDSSFGKELLQRFVQKAFVKLEGTSDVTTT